MKLLVIGCLLFIAASFVTSIFDVALDMLLWVPLLVYAFARSYRLPNDKYEGEGVYILFKRPACFIDAVYSLLFMPVSSVSVVVDKDWYGFVLGEPLYTGVYKHDSSHRLMRVNVDSVFARERMIDLCGREWMVRYNCCHVVQELFDHKFSRLDSIPCFLARTLNRMYTNNPPTTTEETKWTS